MKFNISILILIFLTSFCKPTTQNNANISCLECHTNNSELGKHANLGCNPCHRGNQNENNKIKSHEGLIAIPGNLSNVDDTCGNCHRDQTNLIHKSLMTTNAGMISINRKVFGEVNFEKHHSTLKSLDITKSAADSYFSQLCAACHLGIEKTETGNFKDSQKGGGCIACHITFGDKANHPAIQKTPKDSTCFNCHSRSGRISLNYNGFVEMDEEDKSKPAKILYDGRKVKKVKEDIHKTKGISCTECHKAIDIMGDGKDHLHQETAVQAKCESCHQIIESNHHNNNHEKLYCTSCHSEWAPNCFGCHISYDPKQEGYNHLTGKTVMGKWIEETGEIFIKPPALGITQDKKIRPFLPAMKLSIDKSGFTGNKEKLIKRNLYAPSFSHTITKKGRDCISCHRNSYALGFGEGKLNFEKNKWSFLPEYKKENGLPEDAWIEPFKNYYDANETSIRNNSRPFNKLEQLKILEVGKCLDCHKGNETWFMEFNKSKMYSHKK